jgi:hypothetical protein
MGGLAAMGGIKNLPLKSEKNFTRIAGMGKKGIIII